VRGRLLAAALGALAATVVLVPTSLGESITRSLFGPGLIRAEAIVREGGVVRDYRVDRGRVRAILRPTNTIVLREADGTIATITVAPDARIELGGRVVAFAAIRRGMRATTLREGGGPATRVQLLRR
jgi:hypothetical protein